MNQISSQKVSFLYKSKKKKALNDITLEISENKFILLCGKTGSGKTSFIRAINGLIPHFYSGKFYGYLKVIGRDTVDTPPPQLATRVGTVFQNPENQLFAMNVERELAFSLENLNFPRDKIKEHIEYAVSVMKIEHLLDKAPFELSGGEQQKVAIASILALNPDLIVLDEPLANLDPNSASQSIRILKDIQIKEKKTIIISEHRLEYVFPYIDEIIVIDNGEIVKYGSLSSILNGEAIFNLGLDLPPIIIWLKKQKDLKIIDFIPDLVEDQISEMKRLITQIMASKPNSNSIYNRNEHENKKSLTFNQNPIIIFKNVSFSYEKECEINQVINNISINIYENEIIGIIGENGAGKSTLIRMINGLIKPQKGEIWIQNENIKNKNVYEITSKVGLMFQNPNHQLFLNTVEEELEFSLKNLKLSKEEENSRIKEYLTQLNLSSYSKESPFNLSGGEKKKVSLACILCREPQIVIFDEPTIGQDATQKAYLEKIIIKMHSQGKTIIIVSHDIDFLSHITSRIIVLKQGRIYADSTKQKILSDPKLLNRCKMDRIIIHDIVNDIHQKKPEISKNIFNIEQLEDFLT